MNVSNRYVSSVILGIASVAFATVARAQDAASVDHSPSITRTPGHTPRVARDTVATHDFRNGSFVTTCGSPDGSARPVSLRDGRWTDEGSIDHAVFVVHDVTLADVTGDGVPDAVVTTSCDDVGTAPPLAAIQVFVDGDASIVDVATLDGGVWDESPIVTVARGRALSLAVLPLRAYGPFVGRRVARHYRWDGRRFARR